MELTIGSDDLIYELSLMDRIVSRKPTVPVLGYVRLEALHDGGVILSATDLEVCLQSRLGAQVIKPGVQLVPAKRLLELARTFAGGDVKLTAAGQGVRIEGGQFQGTLAAPAPEEYPAVPVLADDRPFATLPYDAIGGLLRRVAFACAGVGDTRFYLAGVLLRSNGDSLYAVATDTYRLALAQTACDAQVDALLPRKAVNALMVMLEVSDADIEFSDHGGSELFIRVGPRLLTSRIVDGKFPNYERIMPKPVPHKAQVERAVLESAVRRARMVSDGNLIDLALSAAGLHVVGRGQEVGETAEQVRITYEGPESKLSLNASFVLDFLAVAGTDYVSIEAASPTSAVMFKPINSEVEYTYLVMPSAR